MVKRSVRSGGPEQRCRQYGKGANDHYLSEFRPPEGGTYPAKQSTAGQWTANQCIGLRRRHGKINLVVSVFYDSRLSNRRSEKQKREVFALRVARSLLRRNAYEA